MEIKIMNRLKVRDKLLDEQEQEYKQAWTVHR